MAFKFFIGQAVEYKSTGHPPGLFKVVRHLPQEDRTSARKYRIKSMSEAFERTVNECDLSPADMRGGAYPEPVKPPLAGDDR